MSDERIMLLFSLPSRRTVSSYNLVHIVASAVLQASQRPIGQFMPNLGVGEAGKQWIWGSIRPSPILMVGVLSSHIETAPIECLAVDQRTSPEGKRCC